MPYPRLTRQTDAPRVGIVHLGPGAFFRAFIAPYTQDAMAGQGDEWGILAVSLQSPTARDTLEPQKCAYTAVEQGPSGETTQVITALNTVLVAPDDPQAVIRRMADPDVRVVTLTVTEKGYCHEPATGRLNLDHPLVQHDLAHPDAPKTAPGFILAALAARRAANVVPFTVLCCDNLPDNGHVVGRVVRDLARAQDPEFEAWIAQNVAFPSCMVDRITPATTNADIARLAQTTGLHDPACVLHEPFRQWVIEDNFPSGRPAWEEAGATLTHDVASWEAMKLRCLNGTHSAMAYLGYLAGHETVAQAANDPVFEAYLRSLWSEIIPTLTPPAGADVVGYCDELLMRYRNPAIRHRLWQIAMDGSQKLPQRLLGPLSARLAAGQRSPALILAVAGWMRYVGGRDEAGAQIDVRDPLAATLSTRSRAAKDAGSRVAGLLQMAEIFDPSLATNPALGHDLGSALQSLETHGVLATLKGHLT